MFRLIRNLKVPASESHLGIALSLAAITMSLMLWAILWQSTVITYQRDIIQWMWSAKFGGL